MTIKDLENKEIINAYALLKQIQDISGSLNTKDSKFQNLSNELFNVNTNDLDLISKIVAERGLNPGNTKDSVAEEILKNVWDISTLDIDTEVKTKCFFTSINRLVLYKFANIKNLSILLKDKKINICLDTNKHFKKDFIEQFKTIC